MLKRVQEIYEHLDFKDVMNAIIENELAGNIDAAYKFSYAGVGKSGYSFGRSQFDVSNNYKAVEFLRKNGFTDSNINRLKNLDPSINDLNAKLWNIKDKVDKYDELHVKDMCKHVASLDGLPLMTVKTFVHLVDYHNQFNLSRNGKMHEFLKSNKNYILSIEIYEFKLSNTKWGKENPLDVKRRYKTIEKYFDKKEEK